MKLPILIAHRGLMAGPDPKNENHPKQIISALNEGFDCEIDLWYVYDKLYLGHDEPLYYIEMDFLLNRPFWIHAKNLEALHFLSKTNLNYFWHQNDDYVLTSKNHIWTLPGKSLTDNSICVMPEWQNSKLDNLNYHCLGICSDFVMNIRNKIQGD